MYRSIPSETSKQVYFQALDASTAASMFSAKYEAASLETPPIDQILSRALPRDDDTGKAEWYDVTEELHAQSNL